jgi:hypothetical protein
MRIKKNRKSAVVAGVLGLALIGGGTAFAYWTAPGGGTGSATTQATVESLIVHQDAVDPIYPGGHIDLTGTIENPNPTQVKVCGMRVSPVNMPAGMTQGAALVFAEMVPANGSVDWSGAWLDYADSDTVNQTGDLGKTVDITYTLSPCQ